MKKLFLMITLAAAVLTTACGNNNTVSSSDATAQEGVLEVDELLAQAESLKGETVTLEGVCTHICKHGARKIFLMGTDDTKTIRIESGGNIGAFAQESVNSIVKVTGTVIEQRIDEDYLTAWETRVAEQTGETHGTGEEGCASEQKAQGEAPANTEAERIANFRARIAERNEKEGKNFLSFYHIDAESYEIL